MHGKCAKLPKITSEPPLVDQVAVMLNAGNMIILQKVINREMTS